ncbi:hypothetical protein BH18VER1_BH18VER1_19850 [soil metagenome]
MRTMLLCMGRTGLNMFLFVVTLVSSMALAGAVKSE